ncbi:hypothetical protein CSOJ01_03149 [Colletotrichum sojae]|uniref:Uncharacterized protein n=1 Tax=Colletotrichum sojae TaxID=2175907 RepID=A0A8H6JNZ0_9PEZI|nr:hypothetical protein CSOJ01_03149 [Colletotrichum sojae]
MDRDVSDVTVPSNLRGTCSEKWSNDTLANTSAQCEGTYYNLAHRTSCNVHLGILQMSPKHDLRRDIQGTGDVAAGNEPGLYLVEKVLRPLQTRTFDGGVKPRAMHPASSEFLNPHRM